MTLFPSEKRKVAMSLCDHGRRSLTCIKTFLKNATSSMCAYWVFTGVFVPSLPAATLVQCPLFGQERDAAWCA